MNCVKLQLRRPNLPSNFLTACARNRAERASQSAPASSSAASDGIQLETISLIFFLTNLCKLKEYKSHKLR